MRVQNIEGKGRGGVWGGGGSHRNIYRNLSRQMGWGHTGGVLQRNLQKGILFRGIYKKTNDATSDEKETSI